MKLLKPILLLFAIVISSCSSVKVVSDYDSKVNFDKYKTFAFYKSGIDKAQISDLDKKRIMRAVEDELTAKGFIKSENPDMLVSLFTKSREKININQNNNFGWGWNPWMFNGMNNNINVNQYTEGTLFIDFVDRERKELVWQGIGTAALKNQNVEKREERVQLIVKEIIKQYPPNSKN